MGLAKSEEELAARASAFLKAKLKESGVTYAELVKRLKKHGLKETEAGITMKLKRGTFSATFFGVPCDRRTWKGGVVEELSALVANIGPLAEHLKHLRFLFAGIGECMKEAAN
jgi:hypothetical protein